MISCFSSKAEQNAQDKKVPVRFPFCTFRETDGDLRFIFREKSAAEVGLPDTVVMQQLRA